MIKVGFIGAVSKEWMGGLNYIKNLFYAISMLENQAIKPVIFIGKKTDKEIKKMFEQYAIVIEHSMFDQKSFLWYIWKITSRLFGSNLILENLLKKHDISFLSHSNVVGLKTIKTINWIPDFQHLHLPQMFSATEIKKRNKQFTHLTKYSDAMILSSFDALKDFNNFVPEYSKKANVLQFVSQPDPKYFELTGEDEKQLRLKYNIHTPFFYLPNQFWKHKNHIVVFEAINLLKNKGIKINLVCTGHLHDYRNSEHIVFLQTYLSEHRLNDQIKLLGVVDYADVFALIKFSEAVINPSLFEGWSTTVEECKSVGKNMILSDLNVHREQYPEALLFEPENAVTLAKLLESYNSLDQFKHTSFDLYTKTIQFAQKYQQIILDISTPQ